MKTNKKLRLSRLGRAAFAVLLFGSATARAAITYEVTIVGLADSNRLPSLGIDDMGRVAGSTRTSGDGQTSTRAWTFTRNTEYQLSPAIPSTINAVSADGVLVGSAYGAPTVFDWLGNPTLVLPTTSGCFMAVNRNHDIAGFVHDRGVSTAAVYDRFGRWKLVPPLGSVESAAYGINDIGAVVGSTRDESGMVRGFYSNGLTMILPGPDENADFATSVNDQNVVVGFTVTPTDQVRPVLWTVSAAPVRQIPVELPIGFDNGYAQAINDSGQIVGTMWSVGGTTSRAFVAMANGKSVDLNEMKSANARPYLLVTADAINTNGTIAGTAVARIDSGHKQTLAYVATPVNSGLRH